MPAGTDRSQPISRGATGSARARVVLDLVAQGAAAPTGTFLNEDGPVPW
ncbi:hypothetical protein [Amycolatopsis sp. NPDC050768]